VCVCVCVWCVVCGVWCVVCMHVSVVYAQRHVYPVCVCVWCVCVCVVCVHVWCVWCVWCVWNGVCVCGVVCGVCDESVVYAQRHTYLVCLCAIAHAEAKGGHWASSSFALHLTFYS